MFATMEPEAEVRTRGNERAVKGTGAYQELRRRARLEGERLRDDAVAGSRAARRALRRARNEAADARMAAELRVREHPFRAVAIALVGGIVLGSLLTAGARLRRAE